MVWFCWAGTLGSAWRAAWFSAACHGQMLCCLPSIFKAARVNSSDSTYKSTCRLLKANNLNCKAKNLKSQMAYLTCYSVRAHRKKKSVSAFTSLKIYLGKKQIQILINSGNHVRLWNRRMYNSSVRGACCSTFPRVHKILLWIFMFWTCKQLS